MQRLLEIVDRVGPTDSCKLVKMIAAQQIESVSFGVLGRLFRQCARFLSTEL